MSREKPKETLGSLILNLNPKAKIPRSFGLWSLKLATMWLKQNQRRKCESTTDRKAR